MMRRISKLYTVIWSDIHFILTGSIYDEEDHLTNKARPYTTDSGTFKKNHPLMIMVNRVNKQSNLFIFNSIWWKVCFFLIVYYFVNNSTFIISTYNLKNKKPEKGTHAVWLIVVKCMCKITILPTAFKISES